MKKVIVIASLFFCSFGVWGQSYGIEIPDMNVVYAGIPMDFTGGACGDYKSVTASPSVLNATQSMVGSYITVNLTAKDSKGQVVLLGGKKYLVKATPKPELLWNGVADGGRGNKSAGSLTCRFGDNVPFSPSLGKFTVESYSIIVSGLKGGLEGMGGTISPAHLNILKDIKEGKVTISVKYSGTAEGRVSAMFDI
jgi:hypothetical protein